VRSVNEDDHPYIAVGVVLVVGLLLFALLEAAERPKVSIRVQQEGTVIACTVPPHSDNRLLVIGVAERLSSERQLEGERAPVTHRLDLRKIQPCEGESALTAFCQLLWMPASPRNVRVATSNLPCTPD
jgi:hypothetical protein